MFHFLLVFKFFPIGYGPTPSKRKDILLEQKVIKGLCRNPSFGLTTKAKGLQRCGPRGSMGVISHTPGSVGKCEGMNPHTPKAIPTLGDGVPVDSRNFRE